MQSLTISLPNEVELQEARMLIAAALFEKGLLSSGQAAKIVRISRVDFLEKVGEFGVSIFGETEEDLSLVEKIEL